MRSWLALLVLASTGARPDILYAKTDARSPVRKPTAPPPSESNAMPETPAPPVESTKIEPTLLYRAASLKARRHSVYHRPEHGDFADQIYLTMKFARTYDYVNEVVLEPSLRTMRNNPAQWEDYVIEQAYIEAPLAPHVAATVGKKTEYTGSGYLLSPSDLLNEMKDVFDPIYQQQGVTFGRLRWQSDPLFLSIGFIPQRGQSAKKGKAWFTAGSDHGDTTIRLAATAHESDKSTLGLSAARFFTDRFELHLDGRRQARQLWVGLTPETAYSAYSGDDPSTQADDAPSAAFLVGTRFVFTPRRTIVLESYTNQSGLLPSEMEHFFADIKAKAAETPSEPSTRLIGRHYGFVTAIDQDTLAKTRLSASYLRNLDDGSAFSTVGVLRTLSPITSVELAPTFFSGGPSTEFGEMPFAEAWWVTFRGRF